MSKIVISRMQASLVDQVVTLVKDGSGNSYAQPAHLDVTGSGIVVNMAGNASEFFQPAAQGIRYRLTIERET